jgi:2-polyprenyl-6-methoxyphenol hydroxylase-like FAD-dependent oxidoreductase
MSEPISEPISEPSSTPEKIRVRCCIAGGGPAGMMLGLLLARAGIETLVLEKHADFLRDFRGDTVHPSTLEVLYELGMRADFLSRPHQELTEIGGEIEGESFMMADFTHLPTHCKFMALMPQWDFLNMVAEQGRLWPSFHLRMQAEATNLVMEQGRVTGVTVKTPQGPLEVRADLVVAADGRTSTLRERAGMKVLDQGAPIDVLWLRLSRLPTDPGQTLGRVKAGKMLVTLDRGDYWQCAYVIAKGGMAEIQKKGMGAFRDNILDLAPFFHDRVHELKTWGDVKLLTVTVDRLQKWHRPGLLCIGDAAHAMSPIGGVGINLAIQDAVATANILAPRFLRGQVSESDLHAVQARRELPTRITQRMQLLIQNNLLKKVLAGRRIGVAWPIRLMQRWPWLRRIPARIVGLGFRPEHVRSPARRTDTH